MRAFLKNNLGVGTILLLGLLLRLVNLKQSLWLDEAVQAITAQSTFGYIFQEILGDFHPPLYHFLMHFWVRIFGNSEIALRMPSVIFGGLTVWVVYLIVNKLTSLRVNGLIAALFMATAPFHIYYSQEARMYSMTTFFAALSMFFFFKVNENKKFFVLWLVSSALLIYSDYFGFLVLAAQFLIFLWQKKYKSMIFSSLFMILAYLPWFPMFIKQLQTGFAATTVLPEWGRLVNLSFIKALPLTFIKFSIGRITVFNKTLYVLVTLCIAVGYGGIFHKIINGLFINGLTNYKKKINEITVLTWLVMPLILAWGMSLFVPNYQPFRLLLVLPAFYLLLSLGISSIKSKKIQGLAVGFVLVVNLASLSRYYFNPYFQREDWKGLTQYLKNQKNDSLIILPSETSNWPIKYYESQGKLNLAYGSSGISQINELSINGLTDYERVYYIRYLVSLFDPEEKILAGLEQKGYTKTNEISFNQISVWEYKLTNYLLTD